MSSAQLVLLGFLSSLALFVALCWVTARRRSRRALLKLLAVSTALGTAALWTYSRRPLPERGDCALPSHPGELGSICGVRKPEDLAFVPELDLIVTAEFERAGRLVGLRLADLAATPVALWPTSEPLSAPTLGDPACTAPPDPRAFFPHGVSVDAATAEHGPLLAVVTHGMPDTVQLFELEGDAVQPRARWRGCIPYPDRTTGNDVALLRDGSLIATNFSPEIFGFQGWRYRMRAILGITTGDVLRWSAATGWAHIPATQGAGPNGVVASPDESKFYFADGGWETVRVQSLRDPSTEGSGIALGASPDNLSIRPSGGLLATVATLRGELPLLCSLGGRQCRLGWAVLEIDPESHAVSELVSEPGRQIATATSALEVGPYVFIGSMEDDRVGVYRRR
jgi:hypothetical protein